MLVLNDMSEYLGYDAEKTNEFIEDLFYTLKAYNSKAELLNSVYDRYCHNDTYVGDTADKTKLYISAHQKFLSNKYELQRAIYKKYCDIDNNFRDTVDSSPKARIKMSVLKKVRSDYQGMAESMDYHGRKIMNLAQELDNEFGEFADFETPDFANAICAFEDFCCSGGFLDKCINKLLEFDKWSSDDVDRTGFYDEEKNMQNKLRATANSLDSMTVYQPDIAKNSIELVALGASVGAIGAATVLGAKQGAQDITLEKCAANNLSVSSANIPFGNRYAQEQMEKFLKKGKEKAKKNYDAEYEYNRSQNTGKTLAELQALNTPDANFPDYTEMVDKWLAEQEKYFDKLDPGDPNPITGATIAGEAVFTAVFYNKVKTGGDMDIKQKKKWEDAFGIPYPEGDNAYFIYHGQVMDAATLGNVTYSYIGAKYYSDFALYSGGAAVQTKRRDPSDIPYMYTVPDYGDMPEDHESIGLGIKWRKEGFPDDN